MLNSLARALILTVLIFSNALFGVQDIPEAQALVTLASTGVAATKGDRGTQTDPLDVQQQEKQWEYERLCATRELLLSALQEDMQQKLAQKPLNDVFIQQGSENRQYCAVQETLGSLTELIDRFPDKSVYRATQEKDASTAKDKAFGFDFFTSKIMAARAEVLAKGLRNHKNSSDEKEVKTDEVVHEPDSREKEASPLRLCGIFGGGFVAGMSVWGIMQKGLCGK